MQTIDIVIPVNADNIEELAANELSKYLHTIYPNHEFPVVTASKKKKNIYIGTTEKLPKDLWPESAIPSSSEGFSIHRKNDNTGVITSAGSMGLLYGVYGLLEKMGYSFLFSGDYAPSLKEKFNFDEWDMVNEPLVKERTVFNWHNFLSGCTAWNFENWVMWINQSQKMGYNTIMVHAYANNPMFTFEYNGFKKPVGYLTTSAKGRDWSTEHVNDVRRLPGGDVFSSPIFGSKAGIVPDEERVEAIQQLMSRVFQHAEDRGVKVNFALDFDMVAAIPQEMVATIPETDKFMVNHKGILWMGEKPGDVWLPRPDRPEGYDYYKTQAAALLKLYPQVDKFVLWRRSDGSVWDELKYSEIPEEWQKEYFAKLDENPKIKEMKQSVGAFSQAKLAYAYHKAFTELKRDDISVAFGTWRWPSLPAMNEFYPDSATIYILDSEIIRGEMHLHNQSMIDDISKWSKPGKIIPIIWPHHDDGAYIGPPLPSFENFNNTLIQLKSDGFGVIHWMTRPFDIFFLHHSKQVMLNTQNQSIEKTIDFYSEKWFGEANSAVMASYMKLFVNDMPAFGRETNPYFIDVHQNKKFDDAQKVIRQCDERLDLLNKTNIEEFTADAKENYLFFVNYEKFVKIFFEQQSIFLSFREKFEAKDFNSARSIANQFQPDTVLEQYARTIQFGQITAGEQGLLFSMGLRWLPRFLSMKQLVQEEDIRINFSNTSHEELAQLAGTKTYFIDSDKNYWKVLGEKETGKTVVENSVKGAEYGELFEKGILLDANTNITLNPLSGREKLIAGEYDLKLLLASEGAISSIKVDINGLIKDVLINKFTIKKISIKFDGTANPVIKFTSQKGKPILCGLILEP
ncbi:hypothetical protein L3X37_02660 [Sabulilitoribacter arenilitoris]|uniref:Alpha glucuronidase N-terminal domain-containing protein n=1 Tax=Wocania arenilitoris TaxID=2044858 RepID=A0AAE3ELV7_9FLAO|nr:alpha-glucuronidase family glycosyl hydrolase [Wocania arenilitoris]MCF7567267.1 hypothetical protein [Wocania arenilitoris]